ncbi:MAG: hypothetical protein DRP60_16125 [Spirochaetes bacterium]|nr:MAG: hypothetical protein DRP60_16125 [Spirochaetota bacterium]
MSAALRKEPVDRVPVNFYEIGGFDVDTENPDPFNIYSSESWKRLLKLAADRSDLILMRTPKCLTRSEAYEEMASETIQDDGKERLITTTISLGNRQFTQVQKIDCNLDTIWTPKHFAMQPEDIDILLNLPEDFFREEISVENLIADETELGDRGLLMVDTADPLCIAASLFDFGAYTIAAMTEKNKFHKLLNLILPGLLGKTEKTAREFPGRLWRIYGPEYATPPYLPPDLFREYVNTYTGEMIKIIQKHGGMVRLHSHGKIKQVLDDIIAMGVDAIDPVEPPHQGDVDLKDAISRYGSSLTFFGNIEITDIENKEPEEFRAIVHRTLSEAQNAPGFVLMPSASPYGRDVPDKTIRNYEIMLEEVGA